MSLTTTINYDDAADFTFDSTKVQFNGSNATLKPISNPSQVFTQTFASSSGFTFSAVATEFTGGVMRQKDTRPANETFYAGFTNNSVNANWASGSTTGTLVGSAAVSGGRLVISGGYARWGAASNADSIQEGAVRFRVIPNYSGTPGTAQWLISITDFATAVDAVELWHDTGGNISILFGDNAGSIFINGAVGAWSPVSGTTYEIELDFDFTTGATRVFIDGVQLGSTNTTTATRSAASFAYLATGVNASVQTGGDYSIFGVEYFSTVQHTSDYIAPSALPNATIYAADTVSLPSFSYSGVGDIQGYTASAATDTNAPHYTVNGKYWNGSAWVASDSSYTQSNLIAAVNTNIPTLPASNTTAVRVIWQASNTVQMSVDLLTVTYTGQIYTAIDPSILVNAGILTDGISVFASTTSASGSDSVKFILRVQGTDKYWDGAMWVTSDGSLAQSNTSAQVNSNVATLDLSAGVIVRLKALLHSATGATTPSITDAMVTYSFFIDPVAQPNRCIGYMNLNDVIGEIGSLHQAVLVVELQSSFLYGQRIISPFKRTFAFDESGYVETTAAFLSPSDATAFDGIVETASLDLSPYRIGVQYTDGSGEFISALTTSNLQIPDQFSVDLTTLLVTG